MADLIIKPATGDGNKLILQDKDGDAILTTADTGATLTSINALTATTISATNLTLTGTFTQPTTVTGGNATYTHGSYTVHVFTSDGVFSINGGNKVCDILMVGGGGSGGSHHGAAGGAGGLLYGQHTLTGLFNIIIGAGGAQQSTWNTRGHEGGSTQIPELGAVAIGGGSGAGYDDVGGDGGSGGSSMNSGRSPGKNLQGDFPYDATGLTTYNYGMAFLQSDVGEGGLTGHGNPGGTGNHNSPNYGSGGGGGAHAAGGNGTTTAGGAGGSGKDYSPEFGTNYGESGWFAGGGGGATYNGGSAGAGGQGGGADGKPQNAGTPTAALANSGGGGGASDRPNVGGAGGSGIVLIRYLT